MHKRYINLVQQLMRILPHVMNEKVFALKGGTAINFFIRDVPRLSVDIDLVYTPVQDRNTSLLEISNSLIRIKKKLQSHFVDCVITEKYIHGTYCIRLFVKCESGTVVIEPNTVLRGTLYPPNQREINPALQEKTGIDGYMSISVISFAELYGGKIVAALDRQHPRDLFDIKLLQDHEGITDEIRRSFVVYLAGHDRPMHEVLSPRLQDMHTVFFNELEGLTTESIQYKDLEKARTQLITTLHNTLTDNERMFLMSIKRGEPQWDLIPIHGIEYLPALQWKLTNIRKMDKTKHRKQINKLKEVLQL